MKGWVSRLMEKHKKAKNSCCLLLRENNTAQGILCRLIDGNVGPRIGLLTCHHVIPSMAETFGWTIYYGRGESFALKPTIIDNFYSCCNKKSGNEHFCMDCDVDLDFTFIEFNERAPIRRDIELFDLKDYKVNLKGRCRIYKRHWEIRTQVDHEDHDYAFDWKGDQGNFSILNPNEIKGGGTSGCPVVFLPPDGEPPHLLGMHTCSIDYEGIPVSGNASIVWINRLLKFQKKIAKKTFDVLFEIFKKYTGRVNFNIKQKLWIIANRLCELKEGARLMDEITQFCKCISNCCLGFTITFYL